MKRFLLIFMLLFSVTTLYGEEKTVQNAIGLESRIYMNGITWEIDYDLFKGGVFLNLAFDMRFGAGEVFFGVTLHKGKIYSLCFKGLMGVGKHLERDHTREYYLKYHGFGLKNEWDFGTGKLTLDLEMMIFRDYDSSWDEINYSSSDYHDGGRDALPIAKIGYLFYF